MTIEEGVQRMKQTFYVLTALLAMPAIGAPGTARSVQAGPLRVFVSVAPQSSERFAEAMQ
jgi:hypothetical protein